MAAGLLRCARAVRTIVTDVEMICTGLSRPRLQHFRLHTRHYISDPDVIERGACRGHAARRAGDAQGAIARANSTVPSSGIGNAPTALIEVVRLIREEGVRPALVIGMPVGFVSAAESKDLLMGIDRRPLGGHPRPQGRLDAGRCRHSRAAFLRRERAATGGMSDTAQALAPPKLRKSATRRQRGNRTGFSTGACSAAAARARRSAC